MPINIESTLTGIRQGGQLPGQTLAGQIGAMQQAKKQQQADIMQSMMEAQTKQQTEQRQSTKLAHDMQQDQREAQQARLFGIAQQVATMAERDPESAMQILQRSPRVAQAMGVDPRNPDLNRVFAFRDRMRAQVASDIPDPPKENERAIVAEEGTALARALGAPEGMEVKYVGEPPYVDEDGEVVNQENITNFERLGAGVEVAIGGEERAGGDLEMGDVVTGVVGDFPVPKGLEMAAGPRDTLVQMGTRITGVNEFMRFLSGDPAFGEEERIARRIGDELENRVIMAFKPSDDDRTSNLQIKLAQKLAPNMGLLATDESIQTDLETLHARTEAKVKKQLSVANNKKYTGKTREDAEQRAIQLGNLLELTTPLLQAAKDPRFVVENILGKTTENSTPDEIAQTLSRVSQRQRKEFFEALSPEERNRLKEAWSQ